MLATGDCGFIDIQLSRLLPRTAASIWHAILLMSSVEPAEGDETLITAKPKTYLGSTWLALGDKIALALRASSLYLLSIKNTLHIYLTMPYCIHPSNLYDPGPK